MEPAFTKQKSRSKVDNSYIALIAKAILSSHSLRCCLKEIYSFIEETFPDLPEKSPNSWRNSVRHNLSLNDCFLKASRCESGKGNYWTIHPANLGDFLRGDFRRRKAKARIRTSTAATQQQSLHYGPCVQLIPVLQLLHLQHEQAPRECPSARSDSGESSPGSETEICAKVETLAASSCHGEVESSSLTYGDCSDEGSESEDSRVVFVGQEKMEDSFTSNPEDAKLETNMMQCDVTSSPPAKRLKSFSIDNILSHKTRQGRIEEACFPLLHCTALNVV